MNLIILILIFMLLSALFSGIEIAFVSSNKLRIEIDKNQGKLSAKILSSFQDKASKFIAMLLLGNTFSLVAYAVYIDKYLKPILFENLPQILTTDYFVLIIEIFIASTIILIFSEFLPRLLFRMNPNGILKFFSYPLFFINKLLYPIVVAIIQISELILKFVFKIKNTEKRYKFSSVDINNLIEEYKSEDKKEDEKEELKIFRNALEFQELKLRECLVPRTEIKALPNTAELKEVVDLFIESGHSKILLFENDIDNIIGYIHAYDIFKKPESVEKMIRKVDFYPETMQAKIVLNKMIFNQKSISVVFDEFGGTAGIVTLEDLIEEIFGDIEDEFDDDETVDEKVNENTYILSTRLEIDSLNDKYELNLPESETFETLGGFIIDRYENIPDKGEVLIIDNFKITILESTSTKIELIKLEIIT